MTDLGSNFAVHLLLAHMMSLFTDLTGAFIFGTASFLFPLIYKCKNILKLLTEVLRGKRFTICTEIAIILGTVRFTILGGRLRYKRYDAHFLKKK